MNTNKLLEAFDIDQEATISISDLQIIAAEVHRQRDTPLHVAYLAHALFYARTMMAGPVTRGDILNLGRIVLNRIDLHYRLGPAVFDQGPDAVPAQLTSVGIEQLLRFQENLDADTFTQMFLRIHPFEDGNGRVAWVLWNYLSGTLDKPNPLPEWTF